MSDALQSPHSSRPRWPGRRSRADQRGPRHPEYGGFNDAGPHRAAHTMSCSPTIRAHYTSETGHTVGVSLLKLTRPLLRPPLNHHLFLRVKFNCITPLRVHIAEEAFLPAGEREEGHGRGHANVDANIARLYL